MDEEIIDLSATIDELRAAGSDVSKQLQTLLKLGNWYLKKAKSSANGVDFTKADALFNAALVRSRLVDEEISGEILVLRKIVETYREFLLSLPNATVNELCANDDIRHEIYSHKEFLENERRIFKERLDELDFCCDSSDKSEDEFKIHAAKINDVLRDIQDMYKRLVSMLVKECESRLGKPPCDYSIIAMGSVARMEATPFSDLEFAILYSGTENEEKINYLRTLTYFLHLKFINLGETILPALGIEELNNFHSSDPDSIWFYDSVTPRGVSFDGAMPWACKTPLGRMATEDKPALELIRTPEQMAELQDEQIAIKEGYHLADILSRVALLYGDKALLDEYNERVAEKLNATSSLTENESTRTVGFTRGIQQMLANFADYDPKDSYRYGSRSSMGSLFDAKRQFNRLISLLLSDLGLIFDIRCPSPWQIVPELQTRGVFSEAAGSSIKVYLSIANELRLKTYYGYNKQTELISPVPQKRNKTEESVNIPISQIFDENVMIRLLSVTHDMYERCYKFYLTFVQQDKIDIDVFANPFVASTDPRLRALLYYRLHNLPKALECIESVTEDNPEYNSILGIKGVIYLEVGEYSKSVECCTNALNAYKNKDLVNVNEFLCFADLANALIRLGQYDMAKNRLEEGISRHNEAFGEHGETTMLCTLLQIVGVVEAYSRDFVSAIETFRKVELIYKQRFVNDTEVLYLNLSMAWVLSELDQYEQSMNYLKSAIDLSHKEFGEQSSTSPLAQTYAVAAAVYERCNVNDKALSFFKRSMELFQTVFDNNPIPGYLPLLTKVENLEIAVQHARKLYNGKPNFIIALMLKNLGNALHSEKSLEYFQEGKAIMDELLGPNHVHAVTSGILNSMGVVYRDVHGDLLKSLQCLQDALTMNLVVFGEDSTSDCSEAVYQNIGFTAQQMGDLSKAKDYFLEVVKIRRKMPITRDSCAEFVATLYHITSVCESQGEHDDALKFLEEARDVAKAGGYNDWDVVYILLKLIKKYSTMASAESVAKSEICNREAKEMAMILPEDESLPPWLLKRIETLKNS